MTTTNQGPSSVQSSNLQPVMVAPGTLLAALATDSSNNVTGLVGPNSQIIMRPALTRIKAAVNEALAERAWTKLPLMTPPAWAATTVYMMGEVVSNGGNSYMALVDNGTSGSVAPTWSTVGAAVSDGGQSWVQYKTPAYDTSTTNPMAATPYTWTASFDAGFTTSTPVVTNSAADPRFLFSGGDVVVSGSTVLINSGKNTNGTYNSLQTMEFWTDSPGVGLLASNNIYGKHSISIDGQPLTLGSLRAGASASSFNLYFNSRKPRRVRVDSGTVANGVSAFAAVVTNANTRVWYPSNPNRYRMVWSSCSFYVVTPLAGRTISHQVARRLGCDDFISLSVYGDGFLQVGSGQTYDNRTARVVGFAPDVYVVGDSYNDYANSFTSTQIQNAVYLHLVNVRQQLPNTAIILLGTNSTNYSGGMVTCESYYAAAFAQYQAAFPGDNLIAYVPQSTSASSAFSYGTGTVAAQAGNGNSDYYVNSADIHPWQLGADYLADRLHTAILGALQTMFAANKI